MFLDRVAATLGLHVKELAIADGNVLRDGKDTGHDYWSLAERSSWSAGERHRAGQAAGELSDRRTQRGEGRSSGEDSWRSLHA